MITKEFSAGELYGIKTWNTNRRGEHSVVCSGTWDSASNGFKPTLVVSSALFGTYQPLRFKSRAAANRFIEQFSAYFNYQQLTIMNTRAPGEFMPIVVSEFNELGWTNARKWPYIGKRAKAQMIQARPDLYSEHATEQSLNTATRAIESSSKYRGFKFN